MDINRKSIGSRIRIALEIQGRRPSDLAAAVGVSRAAVSGWLKGEQLSMNNMVLLSDYLSVSLNWLLFNHGPMHIAADAELADTEEGLIKILRFLGKDSVSQSLAFFASMTNLQHTGINGLNAHDLISRTELPIAALDKNGYMVNANAFFKRMLCPYKSCEYFKTMSCPNKNCEDFLIGKHFTTWVPTIFHRNIRSLIQEAITKGFANYSRMETICHETGEVNSLIIYSRSIRIDKDTGVQLIIRKVNGPQNEKFRILPYE